MVGPEVAMNEIMKVINKLLVETFDDILYIEEKTLKEGSFNDVTITEVHTIEAIGMYEKKTMSDVARSLDITVGTLTVAVNKLVKKGYVERFKSEDDKRIVLVGLTKKGRLLYRVHDKFHKDMVTEAINGMDEEEAQLLARALGHLNDFLTEKYSIVKGEK